MQTLLDQPAKWFFTLLDEAYRIQARELEMNAITAVLPHIRPEDRKTYMSNLKQAQSDILEREKEANDYSGLNSIKRELK